MRPIPPSLLLAVLLTGVTVAGCGASGTGATPSARGGRASPTPVPGTPFVAKTFRTVIPPGWQNRLSDRAEAQKFNVNGQVAYLVEQSPPGTVQQNVNDVTANINVVVLTQPVPDDQVPAYLSSVSNSGATNVSTPRSFTIDGATGQYVVYDRDVQGTPGESQDMIVNHAGVTYDIILNTSQYAFRQQQPSLQDVLAAWRWK